MQFGLRTLLLTCTVCGVFCAIFFAVPLFVEIPILVVLTLLSPSVWISGACFAKGPWRAFFVGGVCAAWLPQLFIMYYAVMVLVSPSIVNSSSALGAQNNVGMRLMLAGYFLTPFLLALLGGGCGALVYRWFGGDPTPKPMPATPLEGSRLHEPYLLLESRVTPLAKPDVPFQPNRQ